MVLSHFLALKSYHLDRCLSLIGFDDPQMTLIIHNRKKLFSSKKQNCLPIIKDILEKITENKPLSITDLKINMTSKIVGARFMRMGELMYTIIEAKERYLRRHVLQDRISHLLRKTNTPSYN